MRTRLSHLGRLFFERWYVAHRFGFLPTRGQIARKARQRKRLLTAYASFPVAGPSRFLERDERMAMNSRRWKRRAGIFVTAHKDASGAGDRTEAPFSLDLRPEIHWPQAEVARKVEDDQRRRVGAERGENLILGGSDPALSGLAAAQRLRRRGSLPPNLSRTSS